MVERTQRLVVWVPGTDVPHRLELRDGDHLLIGREPDWSRVDGIPVEGRQQLVVGSPSISGNHVLVRADAERLYAIDLGSRNRTWTPVPARAEVTTYRSADPLELWLAPSLRPAVDDDISCATSWKDKTEFLAAISTAVAAWLDARKLRARVRVIDHGTDASHSVGRMPAAAGSDLVVEALGTVEPNWLDMLAQIGRFVSRQRVLFETEEGMRADGLIVASPAMRRAVERVIAAASHGARVILLIGPSGAGKEGLARCFHRCTGRQGPFVARNCAMFNKDLVRAELFGAEKGAFTGSVRRMPGAVEAADEGTLFLDEVGDLPREVQPMLLRFLDHGEYEPIGGHGEAKIADVRIVAATNRDLRAASVAEEFRRDLWFRLSVHVVAVPPLRERPEDLVAYLRSRNLPGGRTLFDALEAGALEALIRHDWQGNFRELLNFAERTSALARQGPIATDAAIRSLEEGSLYPNSTSALANPGQAIGGDVFVASMERAKAAFAEDHGGTTPQTWDELKGLVESYLKPILFAELTQNTVSSELGEVDLKLAAEAVQADRGTALKQLRRYFDRFARSGAQ